MSISIAVQMYTLREDAKADLFATLKNVKDMGYDGVEFAGLYGHEPEEIAEMCKEVGIIPISAHLNFNRMLEDAEKEITTFKTIGVKFGAISSIAKEYRPGTENFSKVYGLFEEWGKLAKAHGIQLMYHNHDFEFVKMNGKYMIDDLYESVSQDLLTAEFDTCWIRSPGEDPVAYIKKYSGRVPVLHFKDLYGTQFEDPNRADGVFPTKALDHKYRHLGAGIVDVPACLEAAKESGCQWIVVEQDYPTDGMTPAECAAASAKYLRSLGL